MNDKPRRPWFQIHLSTAIVTLFFLGVLIGVNLQWGTIYYDYFDGAAYGNRPHSLQIGWPLTAYQHSIYGGSFTYIFWKELAVDLAANFALLGMVAVLSEFLIRRREARAP